MAQKYESYETGSVAQNIVWTNWWRGQTFTPQETHILTQLWFWGYVSGGLPTLFTAHLRATSGGLPTGSDLDATSIPGTSLPAAGAPAWKAIDMSGGVVLEAGVQYAMIASYPVGSKSFGYRYYEDDSSPTYAGGTVVESNDGGVTWSATSAADFLFQEWGNPAGPQHLYLGGNASAKRLIPMRGW